MNEEDTLASLCGFGVHVLIHRKALDANTRVKRRAFIKWFKEVIEYFPCKKCSYHAIKYLNSHRISLLEKYSPSYSRGKDIYVFKWTVDFHNVINRRLNKEVVSVRSAYDFYTNIEDCDDCKITI